jgi:hypothetical protein
MFNSSYSQLGTFRMWTPNAELVPEMLQQQYYIRDEFGVVHTIWVSGIMHDNGIFIPDFDNHKG